MPFYSYEMDATQKAIQAGLAQPLNEEQQAIFDAKQAEAVANGTTVEAAAAAGEHPSAGHRMRCALL